MAVAAQLPAILALVLKGTKVTLRHTGVPDDPFGRQHGVGWDYLLGAVAERFANRGG